MLHFYPEKVETGVGHGAVDIDIGAGDRAADNLTPCGQFLFYGVEDFDVGWLG